MGLLDNLLKPIIQPIVDKKVSQELAKVKSRHPSVAFANVSSPAGISVEGGKFLNAYRNWVYINVRARANKIAAINFKLFRVNRDGNQEELLQHELLELLFHVNNGMTKHDLIYLTSIHLDLLGEAMWFIPRNSDQDRPQEIFPIRPDLVKVIPGDLSKDKQLIKAYEYRVPGSSREVITFEPHEIIFFKYPDPSNLFRGLSPLKAAAAIIDTDEFAWQWNRNFFENSAQPDMALSTDEVLTEDIYRRILNQWESRYRGTKNAHRLAILEAGLKPEKIQHSHRDMDFIEQQRWTRDTIMAIFGNTKPVLGITDDVNRANAEAAEFIWAKHSIEPTMMKIVDYLNEFLVPAYGSDLFLDFESIVPKDREISLKEKKEAVNSWKTINEVREEEGLEGLDGGDSIYLPLNVLAQVGSKTKMLVDSSNGDNGRKLNKNQ